MENEPTLEDVLAGVKAELNSMRVNAEHHEKKCIEAVGDAADCAHSPTEAQRHLVKAAYHAGAARLLRAFCTTGSHNENVWFGKVHQYNRVKETQKGDAQ